MYSDSNVIGLRSGTSEDSLEAQVAALQQVIAQKDTLIAYMAANVDAHRRQIERDVINAIERVVLPLLATLDSQLAAPKRRLLQTAVANLKNLLSPYVSRLEQDLSQLSPAELRVCTLIRDGLSVKEVAESEGISPATVSTHRRSIRRKLGLARSGKNLAAFLNQRTPISNIG